MEEKTDELVQSIQTLNKENDELRAKLKEFEEAKALAEKEAEIKKRVAEELKKLKEQEDEEEEEPEVEEKQSKGVVKESTEKVETEKQSMYIMENGDLTMNPKYFAEFDKEIRNLDWVSKVRWVPNFSSEVMLQ